MKKIFSLFYLLFFFISLNANPYPERYEGIIQHEEKYALPLISALIRDNPIILEAGAHYGIDTQKFAKMWPNSTIFSFEPNPHAFEKLVEATKKFSQVNPMNIALSNYNGEATLHVCYGSTGDDDRFEGASSLLDASDGMKIHYQGPDVVVPCMILDDWCLQNSVDHIDFMWIDLEGMELQILKSSPKILKTVRVIFTETNFQEFRNGMTQYAELKQFLEANGFIMMCHWYREGLQGNAIFLRR